MQLCKAYSITVSCFKIYLRHYRGTLLSTSIKYMPKYSGNQYELRITRVKQDDGGEYKVTAENAYGRVRAAASLTVARKFGYCM